MKQLVSSGAIDKMEESELYMGASIENQHLQAGLLERLRQTNKCEVVSQKVKSIKPATSSAELPLIELEDGSQIEP